MSDSTERLGELLLRVGALTREQFDTILRYQQNPPDMKFGQIALNLGYIINDTLESHLWLK